MSDFVVSARKYRPDTFKTVVGQSSITDTLIKSIQTNKLAHSYLFCGPRGVGKTTCARIFAKTINCFNPVDGEACNTCESCVSFNKGATMNIHEMDAASNNSVEDIRLLIEQVRVFPQMGQYSVYIIDEVHMLSSNAFNAFLKTLEEPPAHAIFILATTEKHKVLPTILSRCQIFDFNRIKINDITQQLVYVAQKENITYDENALHIIATKVDGGMRDALSVFDQIVSSSGGNVTYESVIKNLNVLDYDYFFRISQALFEQNISEAFNILDDVLLKGFEGVHLLDGLLAHYRDVLVSKDASTVVLLEYSEEVKNRYIEASNLLDTEYIYMALDIINQFELSYRTSQNKRLHTELCLVKLSNIKVEQEKMALLKKKLS